MIIGTNHQLLLQLITQPVYNDGLILQLNHHTLENWKELLLAAAPHGLKPLLYTSLERVIEQIQIPDEVYASLKESHLSNAVRNIHFIHYGKQVFSALNEAGIQAIGLKGIYLLDNVYQNIASRTMSDLDIMVRKSDILQALDIIHFLGFQPTTYFNFDDKNVDIKHVPPYKIENGPYLEIHWTVLSENEPFSIDVDDLWQRAIPARIADTNAWSLSLEDLLLHLSLHLTYQHNLNLGLSRLYDIWLLIQQHSETINWKTLCAIAHSWQAQKVIALTFQLLETMFHAHIPPDVFSMLNNEPIPNNLLEIAIRQLVKNNPQQITMTPDLANLAEVQSLLGKIRVVFSRIFLPKRIIARLYNVNPKSPKILYFYFVRFLELFRDYTSSVWKIMRRDEHALSGISNTQMAKQLRNWLGGISS